MIVKKQVTHFLLLFSLFFNIAHATIIATEDKCHHETAHEYVLEQTQASDCGDLCELHHLFHFMAILDQPIVDLDTHYYKTIPTYTNTFTIQNTYETTIKPPIA